MTQTLELERTFHTAEQEGLQPEVNALVNTLQRLEESDGSDSEVRGALQHEVEQGIEELVKNPAEAFAWDVDYMADLYEARSETRLLADGATLQTWGTHDISKVFIDFTYSVLTQPDGSRRYDVVHTHRDGRTAYRLEGEQLTVTFIPRRIPQLGESLQHSPVRLEGENKDTAVRTMFDSSLAAAATAKVRAPENQSRVHHSARYFLADSLLAAKTNEAFDSDSLHGQLDTLHAGTSAR